MNLSFCNGLLPPSRQAAPAERALYAACVFKVKRSQLIDLEQPAKVSADVFFKESRRSVFSLFVGVSGEDDESRSGSGDSFERFQNGVDADVSTDAVKTASVKDERKRI